MRFFGFVAVLAMATTAADADDWLPISPEDLQMTSEAKAPKAPAIYLYRQVDRDDDGSVQTVYARIKILTEEGRKYADVELPYLKNRESIRHIRARTIRPDGSITEFDGTIHDKQLVKARGVRVAAKAFTLPGVQVGSIIEYRYRQTGDEYYVFNSRWILSEELFTRHAKFSLIKSPHFALRWSWPLGLPEGTAPPASKQGRIRLETRDVPAFVREDYMPPEDVMKFRVNFIYESEWLNLKGPERYWKEVGRKSNKKVESFVGKPAELQQAIAQIVQPSDAPEAKLRKLYARTQQIRNLSFERRVSEQEERREDRAEARDAQDVWTRGYGDAIQVTWLFLGLARAAGFEAHAVLVPTREDAFFEKQFMNAAQLNSNAVLVKLDGRDLFLDPGTPFTPFGMLPWNATGVQSLRLDKAGGEWVVTPLSSAAQSRVERKVALKLAPDGTLQGKVTVTHSGLEASWRRMGERNEDDKERTKFLEEELAGDVPSGVTVKLTNKPDWVGSDAPLVAEYDLEVPGWASSAGRRALLPVGLFGAGEKHTFEHFSRVHPLYFIFPYERKDDVTIELPPGWQVSSVPKPREADLKVAVYRMDSRAEANTLRLKRDLTFDAVLIEKKHYQQIRDFFQTVRAGDEDQAIVSAGAATAQR
jgi:hypothetical protein